MHTNVSPSPEEYELDLHTQIFILFKVELEGHVIHFKISPLPIVINSAGQTHLLDLTSSTELLEQGLQTIFFPLP